MNRCMEIQAQITDYIDGSLPPDKLEGFITHIQSCEECREELNLLASKPSQFAAVSLWRVHVCI